MSAELKVVASESFFEIDGDLVLVPPGTYNLKFLYGETRYLHNRSPKLVLWFSIIDMGEFFGAKVARYYHIKEIKGRPGKNGRFKAGAKSDFMREYFSVVTQRVQRMDRIPLTYLEDYVIKAKVKTVEKSYDQSKIPKALHYSVVEKVLEASGDY